MAHAGQHVLGFSSDGKLFALINNQGILRIWDTETNELKQEYTPNLHLAGPCTSLTWLSVNTQEKKSVKKARKSIGRGNDTLYIALGTSTGSVSLYSFALGKIERNLSGEGHAGRVTSIVYDDEGKLYTCGEDCQLIVWSVQDERKLSNWSVGPEKPYSLAYLPSSKCIAVGSRQIKVYSIQTEELVQTFVGHASDVNLISVFTIDDSDVDYAITTSRMERVICLWKIGKKGRNRTATGTLLMEDVSHCLTCHMGASGNLRVASVTRSGVIHVYSVPVESIKAEKPVKPKVTIEVVSDSTTVIASIPAFGATFKHSHGVEEILFGYGDKRFMVFDHITPNFTEKMQVLVRTDPKQLYAKKSNKRQVDAAIALKTVTPVINENDVEYKSALTISRKKLKATEMPMESRLQNLNLNAPPGTSVQPQAQSKVQLLVQALHSKDAALLRSVLCTKDLKTIQLTLQRLPVNYVGALVTELTQLMEQKRTNVEFSIKWLRTLAQTHSSQLMALGADELMDKFGPCIGIIEYRANCLREMSKLNGRLQLLVSQIKRNTEEDNLNSENVLIYEDNDSSNSDFENAAADKNASEGEWAEEDEDEDEEEEDEAEDGDDNMEQDDDIDEKMET